MLAETEFPTLFKMDSDGRPRFWVPYIDPMTKTRWMTVSGLVEGASVETGWTECSPKNVGRANQRSAEEQTIAEAKAAWDKKVKQGYAEDITQSGAGFVKPMLAKKFDPRKLVDDVFYTQPKLDGIRCIATADGLKTRTGEPITSCPHIEEALIPVFYEWPDLILDGELYNHDLRDDFNKITSVVRKQSPNREQLEQARALIQYHVYDATRIGDGALFSTRKTWVQDAVFVAGIAETIVAVPTYLQLDPSEVDCEFHTAVMLGYEGLMIRRNGEYQEGKRSWELMKYKSFQDEEFEIVEILEGNGNWAGYAKVARCKLPDGREFGATLKGTKEHCRDVLNNREAYIGKQATVEFFELTPDGIPRFPVAKQLHLKDRA